ncbi:class I SAM-dependent methyltransferase [Chloroflexota bacterium]
MRCPICKSDDVKVALKALSKYGGVWDIYECGLCTVQYIHPIPTAQDLEKHYEWLYAEKDEVSQLLVNPQWKSKYWRRQYRIIKGLIGHNGGQILDMGCSGGHFLDNVEVGWEKYGIELSQNARDVAASKGISTFANLEQANLADNSFDVVTMFAFIEHIPNPKDVCVELHRILKPGGLLVVMTANAKSLKARMAGKNWDLYHPPEHLCFFSGRSLDYLMKSIGFKKVKAFHAGAWQTKVSFIGPLNWALHLGFGLAERLPIYRSLPVFDHLYSYYIKH